MFGLIYTVVLIRIQTLCHVKLKHMGLEEVRIAVDVQLDHIAPQLSYLPTFLVLMEHTLIQRDKMHVSSVLEDLSAQILLPLQCPVKMGPLASMAPHSAQYVLQGTGKIGKHYLYSLLELFKS